jgi:hypothetical protein
VEAKMKLLAKMLLLSNPLTIYPTAMNIEATIEIMIYRLPGFLV